MKPYGWKRWMWRDEDGGPPSRFTGHGFRKRKQARRILHKNARRTARTEISEQLQTPELKP